MTADQASSELLRLTPPVGEASATMAELWGAFKQFARLSIDGVDPAQDGDRLLFEAALRSGSAMFEVWFSRQLFFWNEGEYHGMRDIGYLLHFEPDEVARGLPETQIWGTGGPPPSGGVQGAEQFFEEVEGSAVFTELVPARPRRSFLEGA